MSWLPRPGPRHRVLVTGFGSRTVPRKFPVTSTGMTTGPTFANRTEVQPRRLLSCAALLAPSRIDDGLGGLRTAPAKIGRADHTVVAHVQALQNRRAAAEQLALLRGGIIGERQFSRRPRLEIEQHRIRIGGDEFDRMSRLRVAARDGAGDADKAYDRGGPHQTTSFPGAPRGNVR